MTHTLVNVSAPPTQRESTVKDAKAATGVTTPQQAARYTHEHTHTRAKLIEEDKLTQHEQTYTHSLSVISSAMQLQ